MDSLYGNLIDPFGWGARSSQEIISILQTRGKDLTAYIMEAECNWSSGFFPIVGMPSLGGCGSSVASLLSNTLASPGVEIFYFISLSEDFRCSPGIKGVGGTSPGKQSEGKYLGI